MVCGDLMKAWGFWRKSSTKKNYPLSTRGIECPGLPLLETHPRDAVQNQPDLRRQTIPSQLPQARILRSHSLPHRRAKMTSRTSVLQTKQNHEKTISKLAILTAILSLMNWYLLMSPPGPNCSDSGQTLSTLENPLRKRRNLCDKILQTQLTMFRMGYASSKRSLGK